jgi:hypothetical protein
MSLQGKAKTAIALYQRSPRDADGWATCSKVIMDNVMGAIPAELVEIDGLRIRLSERGKIVVEYM